MIMCTRVLEHETTFLFLFCYNIIDDSLSSFVNHLLLYFFWTQIFTWQRNSILKVETSHHLSEFWFYDMPFSHYYNALIGTSGVLFWEIRWHVKQMDLLVAQYYYYLLIKPVNSLHNMWNTLVTKIRDLFSNNFENSRNIFSS